jgi:hypothetical protein
MFLSLGHSLSTWAHREATTPVERVTFSTISTLLSATMTLHSAAVFVQDVTKVRSDAQLVGSIVENQKKAKARAA